MSVVELAKMPIQSSFLDFFLMESNVEKPQARKLGVQPSFVSSEHFN